jgi:hypothetical protein
MFSVVPSGCSDTETLERSVGPRNEAPAVASTFGHRRVSDSQYRAAVETVPHPPCAN